MRLKKLQPLPVTPNEFDEAIINEGLTEPATDHTGIEANILREQFQLIKGMEYVPDLVYLDSIENRRLIIRNIKQIDAYYKIGSHYGVEINFLEKPSNEQYGFSMFASDQAVERELKSRYPEHIKQEGEVRWADIALEEDMVTVARNLGATQATSVRMKDKMAYAFNDVHNALLFNRWFNWHYPAYCSVGVMRRKNDIIIGITYTKDDRGLKRRLHADWIMKSYLYLPMYIKEKANHLGLATGSCMWKLQDSDNLDLLRDDTLITRTDWTNGLVDGNRFRSIADVSKSEIECYIQENPIGYFKGTAVTICTLDTAYESGLLEELKHAKGKSTVLSIKQERKEFIILYREAKPDNKQQKASKNLSANIF